MTGHRTPGVAPHPGQPLALTWVTMRLKFGGVVESFWPGSEIEMVSVSHLIVARKALSETTLAHFGNYSPSVKRLPVKCLALCTSPNRTTELPVHRGVAAVIDGTECTFLDSKNDGGPPHVSVHGGGRRRQGHAPSISSSGMRDCRECQPNGAPRASTCPSDH